MKKLLSLLGALSLIGTSASSVVACGGGSGNNGNKDDDFDINAAIKTLDSIVSGALNTYFLSIKTELSKSVDDSKNYKFFNKTMFDSILASQDSANTTGLYNVTLNQEQKTAFYSDLNSIFNYAELENQIESLVKGASGVEPITKGFERNILKQVEFLPNNATNKDFQLSITKSDSDSSVAAYQFGFNFAATYNYVDGNGNAQSATTSEMSTTFNIFSNQSLQDYVEWASTILPAQLFNYKDQNDKNSALHITDENLVATGVINKTEDVFSRFNENIASYIKKGIVTPLNDSLDTILANPEDYGSTNIDASFESALARGQTLTTTNFSLNYQFGAGVEYGKIQNVKGNSEDMVTKTQDIYTAVLSDYDYLIDDKDELKNDARDVVLRASKEYVDLNKGVISDQLPKPYHTFDDSQFSEDFTDFGTDFSNGTNQNSIINFDSSLNETEQKNTYAFGSVQLKGVLVDVTGFTGHFGVDITLPWTFATSFSRPDTFSMYFITYARFRKAFGIHFFEDIKDVDSSANTKAFVTMNVRTEKPVKDGGYDILGPGWGFYGTNASGNLNDVMSTNNDTRDDNIASGFKPYFENLKNIGFSDLSDFGFRDNSSTLMAADVVTKIQDNKIVALKSNCDYAKQYGNYNPAFKVGSGIGLTLVNSLGRLRVSFDTINKNTDGSGGTFPGTIKIYHSTVNGTSTPISISSPFDWINAYLLADNSLTSN